MVMIDKTVFKLTTKPYIEAFDGAANMAKLNFKPVSEFIGIPVDSNQNLDFDAASCSRVEVLLVGGDNPIISSNDNDITWDKGDLYVKFGAFNLSSGSYQYTVTAYFAGDITEGVVLASDNRVNFNPK